MRKTFTYLSLWIVAMFSGIATASAQAVYEIKGEQYPTADWSHVAVTFSYEEIAKAAGYESAAAMDEALDAVVNPASETNSTSMFWCCDSTEAKNLTNWNTQGGVGGFWHAGDGTVVPYGNDLSVDHKSLFFTQLDKNVDSDEFTYWIGQFPNRCVAGTTYTTTIYLKNGENTVTFNFELLVKKPIDLPEATNAISKLNVIGTTDVDAEITYRVGTDFVVDIADIATLAGVPAAELKPVIGQMLMSWNLDEEATEGDCKTDTLMKYSQYNAFYYYVGDETTHVATATTETLGDLWNISGVTVDEETGNLVASIYPGNVETGNTFKTVLYVVYGDKAHQINLNVNVVEPVLVKPEDLTKVGEMELTMERNKDLGYDATSNTLDVAAMAELLGCSVDEMVMMAMNKDGGIDDEYTANDPGFWMDNEGVSGAYTAATSVWFAEFNVSAGVLNVGHMPDVFVGDGTEVCTGSIYFVNGEKYYEVKMTMTIEKEEDVEPYDPIEDPEKWVNVATENIVIKIIPSSSDYTSDYMTTDLGLAHIRELIAADGYSSAITLYAQEDENGGYVGKDQDKYTCDPHPGFWMSDDGKYAATWGASSAFGFTYGTATGIVTWYQYPGQRQVGEKFDSKFFLVNLATGKMITYNVTVMYVDKLTDNDVVGEEDVLMAVDGEDVATVNVDFTAAMTALGIEDASLLESAEWKAKTSSGEFTSDAFDDANGFCFDADGNWLNNDEESLAKAAFYAGFLLDGTDYVLTAFSMEELADDQIYATQLAIDYDGKRYVYNVKLMNEATYTGISKVGESTEATAGNVYDLSGRVVRTNATSVNGLAKGVYVLNGKKYIVK